MILKGPSARSFILLSWFILVPSLCSGVASFLDFKAWVEQCKDERNCLGLTCFKSGSLPFFTLEAGMYPALISSKGIYSFFENLGITATCCLPPENSNWYDP
jgi:hypothetical protein